MSIKLRKKSASAVSIPDGFYVQLFVDIDGQPKVKDSLGVVTPLAQASTLTLVKQEAAAPTEEADKVKLYALEVGGNTELFVIDSSGNEIQVTDGGSLLTPTSAAADLATSGAPVTVGNAAPPAPGEVLMATTATSAAWQAINLSGVLAQDPVLRHASFTAQINTAHYVWANDDAPNSVKEITLPATPADGDRVEISGIGEGGNQITILGLVVWGGTGLLDISFRAAGFHVLLRWSTEDGGQWTNIADEVTARLGSYAAPATLVSQPDGRVTPLYVRDDGWLGRIGNGDLEGIYNKTIIRHTDFLIPNASLTDVTPFSFQLPTALDYYVFEFYLVIKHTGATAAQVSVAVQAPGTTSEFAQNVALIRSATEVTYGSNTVSGQAVSDASARNAGTFVTTVTGAFRANNVSQQLILRAGRSAGSGTYVAVGSWGRVWKGMGF